MRMGRRHWRAGVKQPGAEKTKFRQKGTVTPPKNIILERQNDNLFTVCKGRVWHTKGRQLTEQMCLVHCQFVWFSKRKDVIDTRTAIIRCVKKNLNSDKAATGEAIKLKSKTMATAHKIRLGETAKWLAGKENTQTSACSSLLMWI